MGVTVALVLVSGLDLHVKIPDLAQDILSVVAFGGLAWFLKKKATA